jgi:hypothetical protein
VNIIHPFDECLTHSSTWELETNSISNNLIRLKRKHRKNGTIDVE